MMERLQAAAATAFNAPLSGRTIPENIDSASWTGHRDVALQPGRPLDVPVGSLVSISGWAFDPTTDLPLAGIGAKIDNGGTTFSGLVQRVRPDVAAALRTPQARAAGFSIDIDTAGVALGHHRLVLRGLAADKQTAITLGAIDLVVSRRTLAAQKTDSIDALNGIIIGDTKSSAAPIRILRSTPALDVYGWGFVTDGTRLASTVTILVDGNPVAPARYGISRVDVAQAYHDVRVTRSGFEGAVAVGSLTPGVHEIGVRFSLSDGSEVDSGSVLRVDVQ